MTEQAVTNDNLPEKYKGKTIEQIVEMHQNLERKLGERVAPKLPDTLTAGEKTPDAEAPKGASAEQKAQLKLNIALNALLHGRPEAEKLLNELSVPMETARALLGYAEGAQQKYVDNVHKMAGGKAAYEEMIRWAGESDQITDYERESFLADIESQQPSRVLIAVKSLRDRFKQENSYEPSELVQTVPDGSSKRVIPFANPGEMGNAFKDKRYGSDPVYTAEQQARARVSEVAAVSYPKD